MTTPTSTGFEVKTHFNLVLIVKADMEEQADELLEKHKTWVQKTHGTWGLILYSATKNKEVSEPLDQTSDPTGRVIYSLNEMYATSEGLEKHWKEAAASSGFFEDFIALSRPRATRWL
jgi:hypothetical protein